MKYLSFLFMISILLVSCEPKQDDATAVCNCYQELLKISSDNEVKMQMVYDSCANIHAGVITKLKGDTEAYEEYIEAYTYCQDN